MATRSTIARMNDDGTITSIYCHWDGYPEYVGKLLEEHYSSPERLDALLELGDLSVLAPEIGEQHEFGNTKGWCVAYGRDRGEFGTDARTHDGPMTWTMSRRRSGCEYGYLFKDGVWQTFEFGYGFGGAHINVR